MLVRDCMTRHPVTIAPEAPAAEAERLLTENRIRHLPVVGDGKRLVGLVTRQRLALKPDMLTSLDVWEIARYLANLRVRDVMIRRKSVITVAEDRTVERAAAIMTDNRVGCLPVVDEDDVVVGIITEADISKAFQEMLGLPSEGVRVTVRMPNRPGEFAKLTRVIADQGWGVMGIGTFPTRKDPSTYNAVLKIPHVSPDEVLEVLSRVPDQKVIDIRTVV